MIIHNLILILLNILEAKHDYHVIQGASPDNINDNRSWHKWGGVFALLLAIYFSISIHPVLGGLYLSYRATVFPIVLNLLRGKSCFYLSNAGFEGWFVKKNLECLYYLGGIISIIILNIVK